jgi:hypothetical protein
MTVASQAALWGPFLTSPRAKLDPQGQSCPPGANFVPLGVKLSPGGENWYNRNSSNPSSSNPSSSNDKSSNPSSSNFFSSNPSLSKFYNIEPQSVELIFHRTGDNVMITIFCDFSEFSTKKIGVFQYKFFKYKFFAEFFSENILKIITSVPEIRLFCLT